jgi:hypothetical protein
MNTLADRWYYFGPFFGFLDKNIHRGRVNVYKSLIHKTPMENQPNQTPKPANKVQWIVLVIVILAVAGYGIYAYISRNTNNANNTNPTVNTNHASNTNTLININTAINSSTPITESSDYHFTDRIVNPFDNTVYMIRKSKGEDFCGVNGSAVCDLVEERNGGKYIIADLFFTDSTSAGIRLQGAKLVKFQDAKTLIIQYSASDHGGGYESVYSYGIESKQLGKKVKFTHGESSTCGTYNVDLYTIEKADKVLIFANCEGSTNLKNGVYIQQGSQESPINTNLTQPYNVAFSVLDNYGASSIVKFKANSSDVSFDFSKNQFK